MLSTLLSSGTGSGSGIGNYEQWKVYMQQYEGETSFREFMDGILQEIVTEVLESFLMNAGKTFFENTVKNVFDSPSG